MMWWLMMIIHAQRSLVTAGHVWVAINGGANGRIKGAITGVIMGAVMMGGSDGSFNGCAILGRGNYGAVMV